MSLDPKTVWKKAAARAAASTPNVASGAAMLAVSAALWNPLPLVLWGLGSAAWVLFASTSPVYTRRVLDEDRRATERQAESEREALRAKVETILAWQPYASWQHAGLLPDYLQTFGRLVDVRERVSHLLAERKEDYLAGLGIQSQLTYLLTAYLQFVQARLALLQTLLDFRPMSAAKAAGQAAAQSTAAQSTAPQAAAPSPAAASPRLEGAFAGAFDPHLPPGGRAPYEDAAAPEHTPYSPHTPQGAHGAAARGSRAGMAAGAPGQPSPMTPITQRIAGAHPGQAATAPGRFRSAGSAASAGMSAIPAPPAPALPAALPDVTALLADLDRRIAELHDLATREPATAKTREWHAGILEKQQELLRDCASRDQQLVAQLTAVPDAFDVIAGRISAAQFDAAELAAYTGGVVEQIEETEKFVHTLRPVTDQLLAAGTAPAASAAPAAAPPPSSRIGTA